MTRSKLLDTTPHSAQAEKTVIGAILLDPDAFFKIDARLHHNDFYDPVFNAIYKAIRGLSQEGITIDFVTVSDALAGNEKIQAIGGSAFLAGLSSEVPTASHIEQYAEIVIEKSRRRQLAKLGQRIAMLANEDDQTSSELLEHAEQEFLKLSHGVTKQAPVALSDMCSERFDRYTMLYEADDPTAHYGIRTGFTALDDKLTAMTPGDFIVLAARPSMGKTALALDIARNVGLDQGKAVGILSLEMEKEQIFDRIFGSVANITPWRLTKGLLTEEQFDNMGPSFDRLSNQRIFVDDDPNRTLINIRSKARRLQMEHGLDLLIIDYLQLIQVTDRVVRDNRTREMSHISENIKQLARELQCPILALSQLSRECERRPNKRPQLSDLRDSGSIEQDADRVLMLYRDVYYNEDTEDPDLAELSVLKNRHGPTGCVDLRFEKEKMSFSSMPQ